MEKEIEITGADMRLDGVVSAARGGKPVRLAHQVRENLSETRRYIEDNWLTDQAPPIYAFNTGVGGRKNIRITQQEMEAFQVNLMRAAAAGAGEPMPDEVVRAMMLLRVNAFATNHSGVRVEIVERLVDMLNKGITPVVSSKGSVGASGDLAPLALMSAAMVGAAESKVRFQGAVMAAPEAFRRAGMAETIDLKAKETAALINGATASLAYAVLAASDARRLLSNASISLCLSLEALRAEIACFEDRVMAARPHHGQRRVARSMQRILRDTRRCTEAARQVPPWNAAGARGAVDAVPPRIQDAYSLRCAPQVHGPVLDALDYIDRILTTEINSATDNPLIFRDGDRYSVISGGHFHGQYIAQAMDLLALVVTDLSAISDRRSERLVDPACSFGLPGGLAAVRPGVNPGLSGAQSTGTGLVLENIALCSPASVISLPAKGNTEDHISNSCFAARRTRTVLENAQAVIAVEMLLAAQALDIAEPSLAGFAVGTGTRAAWRALREEVPAALEGGRWVYADIERVRTLVVAGDIVDRVEAACGSLWGD
ncbi:MAG: aromatic amino acid lyase [Nitratireductor sp.]|nr:aromatic amino acid lyase [Nitratireductor sp.]